MSETLKSRLSTGLAEDLQSRGDADALAALEALALPGPREERWRYSQLRGLERALTQPAPDTAAAPRFELGSTPGEEGLPNWQPLERAGSIATAQPALAFRWLASTAGGESLRIEKTPAQPLYLDALAGLAAALPHRHRRLQIAAGVELRVIEQLRADSSLDFANLLTEIELEAGAKLTWLRLTEGGPGLHCVSRSEFTLADGTELAHYSLELGAAWSRHDLQIRLAGKNASARSFGLLPVSGKRHADTQLEWVHAIGDTTSVSRWRAVAAGRSRAVFNGRIQIDAGADGSDADLHIGSLLLSANAEIDAKPELEIYADAVKAAHGAAIGQLDPQALFYLRSRGLPLAQARQLLMGAWCRSAIEGLPAELTEQVEPRLVAALAAFDPAGAGA
jgi:Fe-S cluster assembly protein SufD